MDSVSLANTPDSFWQRSSCNVDLTEPDQTLFRIHDEDGPVHFVVADSIEFTIDSQQ